MKGLFEKFSGDFSLDVIKFNSQTVKKPLKVSLVTMCFIIRQKLSFLCFLSLTTIFYFFFLPQLFKIIFKKLDNKPQCFLRTNFGYPYSIKWKPMIQKMLPWQRFLSEKSFNRFKFYTVEIAYKINRRIFLFSYDRNTFYIFWRYRITP